MLYTIQLTDSYYKSNNVQLMFKVKLYSSLFVQNTTRYWSTTFLSYWSKQKYISVYHSVLILFLVPTLPREFGVIFNNETMMQ